MSYLLGEVVRFGTGVYNLTDTELVPNAQFRLISLEYKYVSWNYLFLKQVVHNYLQI